MDPRNLSELHRRQAERLGPRIALRYKKHGLYHDLTWSDYRAQVEACASSLLEAGIGPGDRVGLLAENRLEWLVADLAILAAGAVNVPPHAPLTARQIHYQLADAGARWLFVSSAAQLDKIRPIRAELPQLKGVVVFDFTPGMEDALSWAGFLQRGRFALPRTRAALLEREKNFGPDDLATIMYTSGTTGNPKGVMLSHANLQSNARAMNQACPRNSDAVILTWLPFSHIYSRTVDHYLSIVAGAPLCLAESADTVVQNLAEIQPTHLSSVPRFYEKVLAAVSAPNTEETSRRLRSIFGPRVVCLNSGGAPLPLQVAKAFHDAGLLLLQGYGLTESAPVISFNYPEAYKLDTVGRPIPGVEVKIADDGEVLTRGPHVMKGYWNNPSATAETIKDGWLHTGDLGQLDADGFLKITGRKKEILVMSSGKKVVPTFIEGLLIGDPCIDQAVVHGEGRNFLTALIVPNFTNLRQALTAEGFTESSLGYRELAKHPAVYQSLERRLAAALTDVASWERVKKFVVLPEPFSVASEELTVSLKLRRQVVLARHQEALDKLYRD